MTRRSAADSTGGGPDGDRPDTTTVWAMGRDTGATHGAAIDFRMLRRAFLERVRVGDVSLREACDAERDLVRAGTHYGTNRRSPCPVCARRTLRNVTYLFGPRLPRSGRCMTSVAELRSYERRPEPYTAYTVEVCISCEWHHLLTAVPCGGMVRRKRARRRDERTVAARRNRA